MGGEYDIAWTALQALIMLGVTIGVVIGIIFGFIKLGLQYAPIIVVCAIMVWYFSGG